MKTMKKVMAILLTVVLLAGMLSVTSLAAGTMVFGVTASDATVRPGDTFTVTVAIRQNPGVVGFGIANDYDTDRFELIQADAAGSVFPGYVTPPSLSKNLYTWFDLNAGVTGDNYSTGHLITYTFLVKDDADPGDAEFSVVLTTSSDFNETALSYISGVATVTVMIDPEDCEDHDFWIDEFTTFPDCTTPGVGTAICYYCGATETQTVDAVGHKWDEGTITKEPTCTEQGVITYTCGRDETHTYTETIDALDHDLVEHEGKAATCEEAGWKAYVTCKNCDYTTYEAIDALGHEWDEGTITVNPGCETDGEKTFACENCEATKTTVIGATGHDWDDGKVTSDATCGEEGVITYECQNCYEKMYKGVDALDHDLVEHEGKAATCEEAGWKAYVTCNNCDYTTYEAIDALGHEWNKGETTVEPGCTTKGVFTYTCKNDPSHTYSEEMPILGHNRVRYEGQAATCTEDGWEAYVTCTRCDYTTYKAIPAPGHSITKYDAQAATCEEAGWEAYEECSNCDYTTYEAIDALGHEWDDGEVTVEPGCETKGTTTYTCKNDPSHTTTADIDPIGHDWDDGKVTTEPTCESKGVMTYTCENDETHTKSEDIAATGHDWNKGEVTKAPGCETAGIITYTCKNDSDHTYTESIPALGHEYGDKAEFTWAEDAENATYTATYTVACKAEDCDHVETGNAVITVETSTAANCQEIGKTTYKASVTIGDLTYTDTKTVDGAAGEHVWNEGEVTTEPTCVDKGVMTYTCTLDETHTKTEDIPATGHSYEGKTVAGSDENGHWYACDNGCDVSEAETHTEGTPATCVSGALCEICGTAFGDVDPEAHVWDEGTVTQEPDCVTETAGVKHFVCTLDETHTKDEEIPAEHTWDEGTVTKEPTTSSEGVRTYHCTVEGCEGTKTESIDKLATSGSGSSSDAPKTGDNTNIALWLVLLAISATGILVLIVMNSKKKGSHTH